jgi:hypothetical protein
VHGLQPLIDRDELTQQQAVQLRDHLDTAMADHPHLNPRDVIIATLRGLAESERDHGDHYLSRIYVFLWHVADGTQGG